MARVHYEWMRWTCFRNASCEGAAFEAAACCNGFANDDNGRVFTTRASAAWLALTDE